MLLDDSNNRKRLQWFEKFMGHNVMIVNDCIWEYSNQWTYMFSKPWGYPLASVVMDDHDLVLKTMVTTGDPPCLKKPAFRIQYGSYLHRNI